MDDKTPFNYNKTNLFNFFVIRKQLTGDSPLYVGEGMEDYISVSFKQQIIDWYKPEVDGRFEFRDYKAR